MNAPPGEERRDRVEAGLIALALFGLYWMGRAHTYGPGDSAQHVMCGRLWGVPHPPGYPLQTALAWAWSHLGWADASAAINGLSGLFAAAAASLFYLLLRSAGCRRAAAAAATALMALSPLFWYYSLVAEVRALNDLLALCCALLLWRWSRGAAAASLLLAAFSFGLGVSHHPTFILLTPAFAVWAWARRPSLRQALVAAGLLGAGLALPYLILGLRLAHSQPAYDLFEVRGWSDLIPLFMRQGLGGPLRAMAGRGLLPSGGFDGARLALHAGWFASSLWRDAGPVGLGLAAAGAARLWREDRRDLAAWLLWTACTAGVFIIIGSQQYPGSDAYTRAVAMRFHLLPLMSLFALAGHGVEILARSTRAWAAAALALALAAAPLTLRPMSLARWNPLSDYAQGWLRDSAPGDILVLGSDDSIFAAWDLELVRKGSAGRVFLMPTMFAFPPYLRSLQARHPDLTLPRDSDGKVTTDWAAWGALNPGRSVLLESSLLEAALRDSPFVMPQGTLLRASAERGRSDAARDAERFLSAPETGEVTARTVHDWTQEVYLLASRREMAGWLLGRLDASRDPALAARLRAYIASLALPTNS